MAIDTESAPADDSLTRYLRGAALEGGRAALEELRRQPIIFPEWLNQQQAARYCGWSEQFFNECSGNGTGPRCVRLGSKVRYRRAWLDEWMLAGGPHSFPKKEA